MGIPKKGSRKIHVNGTDYRWLIRKKPTYAQSVGSIGFTIAIQPVVEGKPGKLIVDTGLRRPDNLITPHQTAVTPKMVSEMIQVALKSGWNQNDGSTFHLDFLLIRDGINS